MVNHAIIGCGRVAQNHVNAANQNGMKIKFCCDLDLEKARAFAQKNKIEKYSDNYLDILADDTIDSVSICTDHKSHTEIAEKLVNKKHLIIEKPFSVNEEKAQDFVKKMDGSKIVSVIAQHRFDKVVNFIKQLLQDNALGEVTLFNANLNCYRDLGYYADSYWRGTLDKEGGSTIINQSFHIVDTLVYLFGIPKEIKTYKNNFTFKNVIDTEDTCVSILNYDNFLGTLSSTNTSITDWATDIKIIGTKGNVSFNIDFPEEIIEINLADDLKEKYSRDLEEIKINYQKNLSEPANYYGLSHIAQFENVKNVVLNKEHLKVSVSEALDTQRVIDMIYKG